ncbi:M23 family metallopeptidase [Sphingomicrobium sp. XHP0235]|uniref:M23 family metallopeptidase n=1 Tax=Sphingomicrobium aquimarinum TaxID=3133971 RepID=UPI0031FE9B82
MTLLSLALMGMACPEAPIEARVHAYTAELLAGTTDCLEQAMTEEFLSAIGGRTALRGFAEKFDEQLGSEREVLFETAFREAGNVDFYRVSRFSKVDSVTWRYVFGRDGRIVAMSIKPTPTLAATGEAGPLANRYRLPLGTLAQGDRWYVAWGGEHPVYNKHAPSPEQRYAHDFVVSRAGEVFAGEGATNSDHYCFGVPIVAPAGGTVSIAIDGIEDNVPGKRNDDEPAGNHVIIDHGDGEYSMLAHFKSGSVAVAAGDTVAAGQMLGECGNSGRSDLPHLHYHLSTAAAYGAGEGLPVQFEGYFSGERWVGSGTPIRGDLLLTAPSLAVSR